MSEISILDREMTSEEFERMQSGFDEHALDSGVEIQSSDRYGFVALDGDAFITDSTRETVGEWDSRLPL